MGVDVYVAKRRAQKYGVLGSAEKVAIHPLHWVNRLRSEDKPSRYLLASHRGSAMGWKEPLARGEVPLVTLADLGRGGKWQPEEGQPVYRFTGGQRSGAIPEMVDCKEWWMRGDLKPAAGYGVPCFWYDCNPIGELVGHLVSHANGEWMVVMVPAVEELSLDEKHAALVVKKEKGEITAEEYEKARWQILYDWAEAERASEPEETPDPEGPWKVSVSREALCVAELDAYRQYIEDSLERIERGGWTPVCFDEFRGSEECANYMEEEAG